jgi:hypothetical protein
VVQRLLRLARFGEMAGADRDALLAMLAACPGALPSGWSAQEHGRGRGCQCCGSRGRRHKGGPPGARRRQGDAVGGRANVPSAPGLHVGGGT